MDVPAVTIATLTPLAAESYAATYRATLPDDGSGRAQALFVKRATHEELVCERMAVRAARLCGLPPAVVPPVGAAYVAGVADTPSLVMPWLDGLVPLSAHPHAARMVRAALQDDDRMRWRLMLWSFLIGDADRRQENYGILAGSGALVAFDANFAFNARCAWYDTGKNALGELSGLRASDAVPPDVLRAVASVSGRIEREARALGVRNGAALARRARLLRRLSVLAGRRVVQVRDLEMVSGAEEMATRATERRRCDDGD